MDKVLRPSGTPVSAFWKLGDELREPIINFLFLSISIHFTLILFKWKLTHGFSLHIHTHHTLRLTFYTWMPTVPHLYLLYFLFSLVLNACSSFCCHNLNVAESRYVLSGLLDTHSVCCLNLYTSTVCLFDYMGRFNYLMEYHESSFRHPREIIWT